MASGLLLLLDDIDNDGACAQQLLYIITLPIFPPTSDQISCIGAPGAGQNCIPLRFNVTFCPPIFVT